MILPLHFEKALPNMLDLAVSLFQDKAVALANKGLTYIIVLVKNTDDDLKQSFVDIEKNNDILLNKDLSEYYEYMDNLIDFIDDLLNVAKKHKDKSEMFMQCYNTLDELLTTAVYTTTEIGYIETTMRNRLKDAS